MSNNTNPNNDDKQYARFWGVVVPLVNGEKDLYTDEPTNDGRARLQFRIRTAKMTAQDDLYITVWADHIEPTKQLICLGADVAVDGTLSPVVNKKNGGKLVRLSANNGVAITPTAKRYLELLDERIGKALTDTGVREQITEPQVTDRYSPEARAKPGTVISADSTHPEFDF